MCRENEMGSSLHGGSHQIPQAVHISTQKALLNPNIFLRCGAHAPPPSRALGLSLREGGREGRREKKPRFLREGGEERERGAQAQRQRQSRRHRET